MTGELRFPISYDAENFPVAQIRREAWLANFLNRHPRLLRALSGRFLSRPARWKNLAETYAFSDRYKDLANAMPQHEEDLGYVGDTEVLTFLNYRRELKEDRTHANSEAGVLYEKQLALIPRLFETDPAITKFFNFGVCYAYVDVELAKRFPAVEFYGIDRSPLTKILNEFEFGQRPNITYIVGDVMKHLEQTRYEGGVFFHSRTALILTRPLLEQVYRKAFAAGFRYIVGFEQFGLPRGTLQPVVFDLNARESIHWRAFMFMHNYPALLKSVGFTMTQSEVFKTDHVDQDYRFLYFAARRDE